MKCAALLYHEGGTLNFAFKIKKSKCDVWVHLASHRCGCSRVRLTTRVSVFYLEIKSRSWSLLFAELGKSIESEQIIPLVREKDTKLPWTIDSLALVPTQRFF